MSRKMETDCRKVREDLDAFVDRELEARREAAIEDHFKDCRPCLQLYRLIVGVKDRLHHAVKRPAAPAHLRVKVLQALDQETAAVAPRWSWAGWLSGRLAPAAAVAIVVVVAIVLAGRSSVQAHDFSEIALRAAQRVENHETHPVMPGTPGYDDLFKQTGLPNEPMPSLAVLKYKAEGCCFGLSVKHPVAHYIYRDEEGKVVSVAKWKRVSPDDKVLGDPLAHNDHEYVAFERGGVRLLLWDSGDVFWSVFGRQPVENLLEIASVIRS